jgi:energy-coupling factor transporter ATP-binding protein EcfA2
LSISLENVTFRYQGAEKPAIKNVDLYVRPGEVVGILGAIGSGKSTLLLTLNGFIPKETKGELTGRVLVDDLDVRKNSIAEMVRHVGLVLPDPDVSTIGMTVEDDLAFGPTWLGLTTEEIQERVAWAAEAVRLSGFEKRNTSYLSGGEHQALCIGGALAMKPQILALDEPITMLDPVGKVKIISVVEELSRGIGSTIVISEGGADIDYISPLLDRCVVIKNGEVLLEGKPEEVFAEDKLLENALVRPPQASQLANRLSRYERTRTIGTKISVEEISREIPKVMKKLGVDKVNPLGRDRKRMDRRGDPQISIENLCHRFEGSGGGIMALAGINLQVWPGEFIGLIGENGSGKTTLSLHLVGELKPTNNDAKVVVEGIDILSKGFHQADLLKNINYVFQNPNDQIFLDTVWEEIAFGLRTLNLSEEEVERRVQEVLEFFGLTEIRDKPTLHLSKDEKTFVATASIVALESKIVVVDEPTCGLDYWKSEYMMSKLKTLNREKGVTLIIITHNMRLVAEHTDRVVVLSGGKVFMDGVPEEVFADPEKLREASLAPPPVTQVAQSLEEYSFPRGLLSVDEFFKVLNRGGEP